MALVTVEVSSARSLARSGAAASLVIPSFVAIPSNDFKTLDLPVDPAAEVIHRAADEYLWNELFRIGGFDVLVQPEDRGTTAAVAYALASIAASDPDAITGFFPADHYFTDDDAFAHTLDGVTAWLLCTATRCCYWVRSQNTRKSNMAGSNRGRRSAPMAEIGCESQFFG